MRKILVLAILLTLCAGAIAMSQRMNVNVLADGGATVEHELKLDNDANIQILLFAPAGKLSITADGQTLVADANENRLLLVDTQSYREIRVRYKTTALTSKDGENWTVRLNGFDTPPESVRVILPDGFGINGVDPAGTIEIENDRLAAVWKKGQIADAAQVLYSTIASDANVPNVEPLFDSTGENWFLPGLVVLVAVAIGLALWFKPRKVVMPR